MSIEKSVQPGAQAVEIFYSYAHEDQLLRQELEKHLSMLKRQGLISNWHDRLIQPGSDWSREIDNHLATAHIILFLVSADFLASDYAYGIEVSRAMKRHALGEARVIPIILRPTYWQGTLFGHLQALPTGGKPVTLWNDADLAFVDIVSALHKIIIDIRSHPPAPKPNGTDTVALSPPVDRWQAAGAFGGLMRTLVAAREWGRAEATARMIEESSARSQTLCNLAIELAENQQWQRAEAITYTIEDMQSKETATVKIVHELIAAREWARAETITRTIATRPIQASTMQALSQALLMAGQQDRAFGLAYDPSLSYPYPSASYFLVPTMSKHNSEYQPSASIPIRTTPGSQTTLRRRSTRSLLAFSGAFIVTLTLVALAVVFSLPTQRWFGALLAYPPALIGGIIVLLAIIGSVILIRRRRKK